MKALKKPLEASEENVHVKIGGKIYRCANLKKSGIIVKSKILIAHEDVWQEIDVIGLGSDDKFKGLENSNLHNFKTLVETKNLSPNLLNLNIDTSVKNYELTHEDYISLDQKYGFSYIYIDKLVQYFKATKQKTGEHHVKETLVYLKKQGRTIQEYIACEKLQANEIINNSNKIIKMSENTTIQAVRIEYLQSLGFIYEENPLPTYIMRYGTAESPARFEVSLKSIEEDTEEEWDKLVERIEFSVPMAEETNETKPEEEFSPEVQEAEEKNAETLPATPITTESPTKKRVALSVIGSLTPDRILEFQSLKENQEKIVSENPFIKPTDKASYEKAKKSAAILLKASTAIDSPKEGIKANKNKFLKQLSNVLDNFLDPLAKSTRTAYDKQQLANDIWKNAEALRIQNEEKAKLAKVNERTQSLFDIPMVFNGTHYTIGILHIMPSQITSATDEDFEKLVAQAKGIKSGLDAAALANTEKDVLIKELQEQLAKLTAPKPIAATSTPAIEATETVNPTLIHGSTIHTAPTVEKTTIVNIPIGTGASITAIGDYVIPDEENILLSRLDLENLEHIEKPAYLKCRSYYVRGIKELTAELRKIFASDHPKKSEAIKDLLTIIEKSV